MTALYPLIHLRNGKPQKTESGAGGEDVLARWTRRETVLKCTPCLHRNVAQGNRTIRAGLAVCLVVCA